MTASTVQSAVLPTARLIGAATAGSALVGAVWWMSFALGAGRSAWAAAGLIGAAAVGVAAVVALLAIRPWKRRSLAQWPFVWLAGSGLRIVLTLSLAAVLYFALSVEPVALASAVAATYLITLVAETWLYVNAMQILPPLDDSPAGRARAKPGVPHA